MQVLLLDASFQPMAVISARRLVGLLSKQRVTFVSSEMEAEVLARLEERKFVEGPVVVKLLRSIRIPRRLIRPTRQSIYLRDEGECQYCGKVISEREATIDHVQPLSKEGHKWNWENLVIACKKCNHKKGCKTLKESGMRLRRVPEPLYQEYATFLLLKYPQLQAVYENLFAVA